MESLLQLLREWEIQLLVLLSFMLQVFLFFTGGLRRRTTSSFLRFLTWLAYLGADMVAVYTLGLVSRHDECRTSRESHQLVFLWAPFLLVHLGGQDTITAFAIEDNNLWLRHLLNLVVEGSLVSYIFWKSADGLNRQLLVPGIFVFVAGIIKYGERSWALWCGRLKVLGAYNFGDTRHLIDMGASYAATVAEALNSMSGVRDVFAESVGVTMSLFNFEDSTYEVPLKVLEIQLGLMYDDIFTKAMVLRTRGGIILRCISQISIVVAFVIFLVSSKERYESVDIAITYALFTGGFFLEVCAIVITVMSPWTWKWLEVRKCHRLSRCLLSNNIGWRQKRPLWSNSMGKYNLRNNFWLQYGEEQFSLWRRVDALGGLKLRLRISKLLDTKIIKVDEDIEEVMRRVEEWARQHRFPESSPAQQWPNLDPVVTNFKFPMTKYMGHFIVQFHLCTEVLLSRYSPTGVDGESSVCVCRKLSNYMVYILATRPEMLPVKHAEEALTEYWKYQTEWDIPDCIDPLLEEVKEAWIRLLIYVAGKSRPEAHAAQLARGGELLTFVWLLMAHHQVGNDPLIGIELSDLFGDALVARGQP